MAGRYGGNAAGARSPERRVSGNLVGMDPDIMLTIAFVSYAVLVTVGIGVLILVVDGQREPGMDDDAARLASRLPMP